MRRAQIAMAVAIACSYSQSSLAQTASLPDVVVTASPVIESNTLDGFSGYSTSVSKTQIQDLGALDLASALRMTPGIQISRYNEVGSYSGNQGGTIYIRGMGASRPGSEIKTYLDGVPLYMGIWNHPLMDLLPLNAVQSVDIYKSAQPQVSGNNFGAVNLTSQRATVDGVTGGANMSIGSFSTKTLQAHVLGKKEDIDYGFAAGYIDSNGDRSNSDSNLQNALARVGIKINSAWSASAMFLSVNNKVGDPGDSRYATTNWTSTAMSGTNNAIYSNGVARNNSSVNMVSASLSHQHEGWTGDFKVFNSEGNNDLVEDASYGTFNTAFKMTGFRWREEFTPWTNAKIIAGLDQDDISGDMSGPFVGGTPGTVSFVQGSATIPSFKIMSTYLGVNQKFNISENWVLQPSAGVRTYYSNHYDAQSSPHAGLSLMGQDLTLYANYAKALLYPGAETYALTRAIPFMFLADGSNGWNTLSPTEDQHSEIGMKWEVNSNTRVDMSVFQDEISKRYTWSNSGFVSGSWSSSVYPDYQISGAEISIQHSFSPTWKMFGGLTFLDSSLSSLPYAPSAVMSLGLNGQLGAYKLALDTQTQSSMYSMTQERGTYTPEYVSGFTIANMRIARPIQGAGKNAEVYASLNNLFDKTYVYNAGYTMPGRNFRVGLITHF